MEQEEHGIIWIHGDTKIPVEQYHSQVVTGYLRLNCTDGSTTTFNSTCPYPLCPFPGCTDPTATNYNPFATSDDGSCTYACTAAPYFEDFDASIGTFSNAGWVWDAGGTSSGSTGPSDDVTGGGYYMYYETWIWLFTRCYIDI